MFLKHLVLYDRRVIMEQLCVIVRPQLEPVVCMRRKQRQTDINIDPGLMALVPLSVFAGEFGRALANPKRRRVRNAERGGEIRKFTVIGCPDQMTNSPAARPAGSSKFRNISTRAVDFLRRGGRALG